MTQKQLLILLLILLLGIIVRFFRLSSVPVALNGDEAGFGYNAFAIWKSLHDEHGQFLPLVFKSFGDYKPPVLVYLLSPLVGIFGLSEFIVRLPVAIAGTAIIILVYFISKKLFDSTTIGLISAFLVAISPWSIIFSRNAWEATMGMLFSTVAVLIAIYRPQKWWFLGAGLLLVLSMYTYHAEKVAAPMLLGLFFIFAKKKSGLSKKNLTTVLIILAVLITPLL